MNCSFYTALEAAGVEFIAENGDGAGVLLRKRISDLPKSCNDPEPPSEDDESK